ncbi:MAG: RtcB family protein [Candidatus Woesearchaeota archaeon]|jgi:tRNA-splicing ligase RtcB
MKKTKEQKIEFNSEKTKEQKIELNSEKTKEQKIEISSKKIKETNIELKEVNEEHQKRPKLPLLAQPKKVNDYSYIIEKTKNMNVPVKIFASEKLMKKMQEDNCLQQGINVSMLPGIKGASIMMPDAHQGYGFSIGGVAAFDHKCGCISPGGIGYDINCGVRLLTTNLTKDDLKEKIKPLLNSLFKNIPPGVGGTSLFKLDEKELDEVLKNGPIWAINKGYGVEDDLLNCESNGKLESANPLKVSQKAKSRGKSQLGTLGSGNHFLEIQYVQEIFDKKIAKTFGITKENQVVVLIHSGSRGLGHQVCSDYLRLMEDQFPEIMAKLPEKSLIYAPAESQVAKDYFSAMCAAANFAWTNRQLITHQTRKSFNELFGDKIKLNVVYDVAHNIAKLEEHLIDGKKEKVWVHRKGATRAFGPNNPELPEKYQKTGQPIFIPGSMGTSSYVLVGTKRAMLESFGSTAHGAGRMMSRHSAIEKWNGQQLKDDLEKENIYIKASSIKGLSEEAPLAYKDVDEVVKVSDDAGIGKLVARLKPMGVVKG